MKLAMIGIGHVAEHQLDALNNLENIRLTDAYDIDPYKQKLLTENIRFHKSLESLLEQTTADFVLISTPNRTHFDIALQALNAGYSVIIEKPCANSLDEMQQLIRVANDNGLIIHTALHAKFANDVNWFLNELKNSPNKYGQLTGFHCGFYDPYYIDGKVVKSALSLGGSWFDSGINALSVICQFIKPENLKLIESHMSKIEGLEASQLQGNTLFSFGEKGYIGNGTIDTNWTLNLNQKVTHLFYHHTGFMVTLDHSKEKVIIYKNNKVIDEIICSTDKPRLTNHYINLFKKAYDCLSKGQSNQDYSLAIHEILYKA